MPKISVCGQFIPEGGVHRNKRVYTKHKHFLTLNVNLGLIELIVCLLIE